MRKLWWDAVIFFGSLWDRYLSIRAIYKHKIVHLQGGMSETQGAIFNILFRVFNLINWRVEASLVTVIHNSNKKRKSQAEMKSKIDAKIEVRPQYFIWVETMSEANILCATVEPYKCYNDAVTRSHSYFIAFEEKINCSLMEYSFW